MVISNITYVPMNEEVTCSMSACLAMLLSYYGISMSIGDISDLFGSTFLSTEFHKWNMHAMDLEKYEVSEMMTCAQYIINTKLEGMVADVVPTHVPKVKLSYIKRGIPVIATGKFPLLTGHISNSILIKGYVDDYLIVNDPRGNANSGYRDRFGENLLYEQKDLARWISSDKAHLLRVLQRPKK